MSHHVVSSSSFAPWFHHDMLPSGRLAQLGEFGEFEHRVFGTLNIGFSGLFPQIEHGDVEVRDLVGWILDGPGGDYRFISQKPPSGMLPKIRYSWFYIAFSTINSRSLNPKQGHLIASKGSPLKKLSAVQQESHLVGYNLY